MNSGILTLKSTKNEMSSLPELKSTDEDILIGPNKPITAVSVQSPQHLVFYLKTPWLQYVWVRVNTSVKVSSLRKPS